MAAGGSEQRSRCGRARSALAGELRADRPRARRRPRSARRRADALRRLPRPGRGASARDRSRGCAAALAAWAPAGALAGVVVLAGAVALRSYGSAGALTWPLAFVAAYLLALFLVLQLLLWPLAVAERDRPLRALLTDAGTALVRRPTASLELALALLLINALGAAAAGAATTHGDRCVLVRRGRPLRAAAPTRGGLALMASVTFDDVSKRFDVNLVVDGLSLEIADGEFLVLRRPLRLRQEHGDADGRGPRGDQRRPRSSSAIGSSTTCRRRTATWRWSSRATRSTRT